MLQNWTTTLIDDTNLFIGDYILHVWYNLKAYLPICPSIGTLFGMIACMAGTCGLWRWLYNYIRRIGAMSKNKCSKIAPLFEIQHNVSFRRISVAVQCMALACMGSGYNIRSHKQNTKHDIPCTFQTYPINFATCHFCRSHWGGGRLRIQIIASVLLSSVRPSNFDAYKKNLNNFAATGPFRAKLGW